MKGRKVEGSKDGKEGGREWKNGEKGKGRGQRRREEEVKKRKERGSMAECRKDFLSALSSYRCLHSNTIVRKG